MESHTFQLRYVTYVNSFFLPHLVFSLLQVYDAVFFEQKVFLAVLLHIQPFFFNTLQICSGGFMFRYHLTWYEKPLSQFSLFTRGLYPLAVFEIAVFRNYSLCLLTDDYVHDG